MKMTLLDLTQNILSRMSSDEVNSISDTTEAMQVATIVKNKYLDIINRVNLTEHDQLIQLNASNDPTAPVLMYVPSGIADIQWLKYFDSNVLDGFDSVSIHDINVDLNPPPTGTLVAPGYLYVNILPVKEFIDMVNGFNPAESNVASFTFADNSNNFNTNYTFYYKNDRQPRFCTIVSNYYVIFDSFDNTQDTTLQSSKTMGFGRVIPSFTMEDTFIPDLAEEQFQLLLNEATALAFYELKQQPHQLATLEASRGWSNIQKNKSVDNKPTYFDSLPNFGRRGRGFHSQVSAFKSRGWDR